MAYQKGIDVSYAQGRIDWAKAKNDIDFAIIRSSLGWTDGDISTRRDSRYPENRIGCETNNIPYGIYHYSYCLKPENAKREAEYFLKVIEGSNPSKGVWLDIEDNKQIPLGKTGISKIVKDFCETVKAAGYNIGIYSYTNFLNAYIDADLLKTYPVWVAQVNVKEPTYKGDYIAWQYSWEGRVSGINGDVDLDYYYGEAEEEDEKMILLAEIEEKIAVLKRLLKGE